ncbi:hypothetical protein M3Y95_00016300 [Aphelenchoides besseyi]|nr:hypothetical protein M3Y95_00016300 [Aphelenchoides besseyi]
MTELQHSKPKLLPHAATTLFRFLVKEENDSNLRSPNKQAFRLMLLSNKFCSVTHAILRNSHVALWLSPTVSHNPNQYTFYEFSSAPFNDKTALCVFKLTAPSFKSLFVLDSENNRAKEIDPTILSRLIGVSEYTFVSEHNYAKYPMKLAEKLSSNGDLKLLNCNPQMLAKKWRAKSLSIDKYFNEVSTFISPCDIANLLNHKFREIHLQIDHSFMIRNVIFTFSNTSVIQPAIEEIHLETMVDEMEPTEQMFLPLNFYSHVPNLKKMFYYAFEVFVYHTDGPLISLRIVLYLVKLFKHVKEAVRQGTQTQFVFILDTPVSVNQHQNIDDFMKEFITLSIFADTECKLVNKMDIIADSDFQSTKLYERLPRTEDSTPALICTGQNLKLFLWPSFQMQSENSSDSDLDDEDMNSDMEDEYSEEEIEQDHI